MAVTTNILKALSDISGEENVSILYACESGSRAWGFASPDSDYDVRFLYLRPTEDYLRLRRKRDVIERPISEDLDVSGWDLGKALLLLQKSNPPLLEWLRSPIVYRERKEFIGLMRELSEEFYSPVSCRYHYLHMAEGNFREYLKMDQVRTKKYFYVLRPLLACRWIERERGPIPMEFEKLVERTVDTQNLREAIADLLTLKKQSGELADGPRITVISDFLESEIIRLRQIVPKKVDPPSPERLENFFLEVLRSVNL